MTKYFTIIIFILCLENCIAQNSKDSLVDNSIKNAEKISLIQLISNPEKYDGKVIEVQGFLCLEFEGHALYLQKDDYEYFNLKNGISIIDSVKPEEKKKLHLKFVTVIGKFYLKLHGKLDSRWSGWLITENIEPSLTRKELDKM